MPRLQSAWPAAPPVPEAPAPVVDAEVLAGAPPVPVVVDVADAEVLAVAPPAAAPLDVDDADVLDAEVLVALAPPAPLPVAVPAAPPPEPQARRPAREPNPQIVRRIRIGVRRCYGNARPAPSGETTLDPAPPVDEEVALLLAPW
jgi:hypothetical protein